MNRGGASSSRGVKRTQEATPMPLRMTRSASSISAQQPQPNLAALIDSPGKRSGKKLDYTWETEVIVKKSKSENCNLDKDQLGMHLHAMGDKQIGKIAHEMVEAGEKVPPVNELVDNRATVLVTASETSNESDAVSEAGSTATGPSRHHPNVAYLEIATPYKVDMKKLDLDMRMSRIEDIMNSLKLDLTTMKLDLETIKVDVRALKQGIDAILRFYGIDPVTLQPMNSLATPAENMVSTTGPKP